MRRLVTGVLTVLGLGLGTLSASAAPCAPGSLQDYIDLAAGCTVGSVTFSSFAELSPPAGATPIAPGTIGVSPIADASSAGLLLTLNVAATAGQFFDAFFAFQVTDSLVGASAAMAGANATGDGAVTVVEDLCQGAAFIGGACAAPQTTQILFAIDGDSDTLEATSFPAVGLLGVLADIGVDGGPGGGAALATVTLRFESAAAAPVAEPSPMLLLWPAIAAAVWLGRRSVFGLRHPHVVPRAQA